MTAAVITVEHGDHGVSVRADGAGRTVVELTPPAALDTVPPMVLGINTELADYTPVYGGQFQQARVARVFTPPGKGIMAWEDPKLAKLPPHVVPHLSFKDWPSDAAAAAAVRAHLDRMPPRLLEGLLLPELGISYVITYEHEPENNGVPVLTYQRRYQVLYDAVKSHRFGSRVAVVPVQTLTWTVAKSTASKPKGDGNVFQWWAGVGDYAGIDCYAFEADPYPNARKFLAPAIALAAGTGRRLWVPEFGTVKAADDPNGQKRAVWVGEVLRELSESRCAVAAWWQALGARGLDFRLDTTGVQAWNAAAAALAAAQ